MEEAETINGAVTNILNILGSFEDEDINNIILMVVNRVQTNRETRIDSFEQKKSSIVDISNTLRNKLSDILKNGTQGTR